MGLFTRVLQAIHQKHDRVHYPFYGSRGDLITVKDETYILRRSVLAPTERVLLTLLAEPTTALPIAEDSIDKTGIIARPVAKFEY